ncbi:MAG: MBL fold metallo-hydrolase [Bacteroidaceae bacterium]|nr:MBL fold metallo-hydrolase [Bacteroidaceae bacterium]
MKLTFLGTGTSTGVPELGCKCEVCTSNDPRDTRLRCSALLENDDTAILIDCGPDFRAQMLRADVARLDALVITHKHYDHTAGIDDLRPFASQKTFPIYANEDTAQQIRSMFPYCFGEVKYPGVPNIEIHSIEDMQPFTIGSVEVEPIRVFHAALPIVGYRFGKLAYITDMSSIELSELDKLKGVEVLVINALRYSKPHRSHQTVLEALRVVDYLSPRETYFTHMMHHIGLHSKIEKCLPKGVFLAYDGLEIEFE